MQTAHRRLGKGSQVAWVVGSGRNVVPTCSRTLRERRGRGGTIAAPGQSAERRSVQLSKFSFHLIRSKVFMATTF